jgi:hypothetical protein
VAGTARRSVGKARGAAALPTLCPYESQAVRCGSGVSEPERLCASAPVQTRYSTYTHTYTDTYLHLYLCMCVSLMNKLIVVDTVWECISGICRAAPPRRLRSPARPGLQRFGFRSLEDVEPRRCPRRRRWRAWSRLVRGGFRLGRLRRAGALVPRRVVAAWTPPWRGASLGRTVGSRGRLSRPLGV